MQVRARFFASHRERTGRDRWEVELPDGATIADLITRAGEQFPSLRPMLGSARFALNREYAETGSVLQQGDEVAFVPPVAGGCQPW